MKCWAQSMWPNVTLLQTIFKTSGKGFQYGVMCTAAMRFPDNLKLETKSTVRAEKRYYELILGKHVDYCLNLKRPEAR